MNKKVRRTSRSAARLPAGLGGQKAARGPGGPPYVRIATEEAFATPELFAHYRKLLADGSHNDPGFASLMGFYLDNPSPRIQAVNQRMLDLGERRLGDMDSTGIARQILSLTSPGVQVFDADTAVHLARASN